MSGRRHQIDIAYSKFVQIHIFGSIPVGLSEPITNSHHVAIVGSSVEVSQVELPLVENRTNKTGN